MGVNAARGEVALVIDGQERRLRLTLGALAGLETKLGAGSLVGIAERFEGGEVRAAELMALLAAGLEGAGEPCDEAALASAEIEGGAAAALHAGLSLLARSFGADGA
ncbi:MAG: GTA-gp10 family protein [Pseudomonadota bacterium]